jgi:hypothetical protein
VLAFDWIEALAGVDAEAAISLGDVAYERRTGKAPLPFGMVLEGPLDGLDFPTPEVGTGEGEQ